MASTFQVLVLNQISPRGLERLPADRYRTGKDIARPDAILLRSADLHGREIPTSVLAVARAGAGTNNIPVAALSARGVPVFNAPGGNANAVKELVLAGMLMAARHLPGALGFVAGLDAGSPGLDQAVEDGKKAYAGRELAGQTLGVIGLGRVGCLVADAAIRLGMNVLGHDPEITVDAAWSLPSQVRRAQSVAPATASPPAAANTIQGACVLLPGSRLSCRIGRLMVSGIGLSRLSSRVDSTGRGRRDCSGTSSPSCVARSSSNLRRMNACASARCGANSSAT